MRATRSRSGFTLVDLIVCILLGLVLLAVLLPAIARSRHQARIQGVSYGIWDAERSIQLLEEEVVRVEDMKKILSTPGNELREELLVRGQLNEELSEMDRYLAKLRDEISRLNKRLGMLKEQQVTLIPARR